MKWVPSLSTKAPKLSMYFFIIQLSLTLSSSKHRHVCLSIAYFYYYGSNVWLVDYINLPPYFSSPDQNNNYSHQFAYLWLHFKSLVCNVRLDKLFIPFPMTQRQTRKY
jgi:hypothetical protein